MDVEDTLAARGVTTGSATGQDLKSRLTAQLLGPLQAQHAQALANAQAERLSRLTGLVGMELNQTRAQQEADYRRQRDAVEDAYRQGQISLQQRQFEQSQQASANQLDWQKQLQAWQREDRTQQQQAAAQQRTAGGGGGGGMDPAERARAIIMGGSRSGGGGGGGGSDLPITPTGHTMGGGAGLAGLSSTSFGEPTPNWNSGAGRSGAPRPPRAFEGPGTSTVHSASGGGQTTAGTGTWASSSPTWTPQTSGPSQNMSPTSQRFQAAQGPGPAPTTLSSLYQPKPRQWGNA